MKKKQLASFVPKWGEVELFMEGVVKITKFGDDRYEETEYICVPIEKLKRIIQVVEIIEESDDIKTIFIK